MTAAAQNENFAEVTRSSMCRIWDASTKTGEAQATDDERERSALAHGGRGTPDRDSVYANTPQRYADVLVDSRRRAGDGCPTSCAVGAYRDASIALNDAVWNRAADLSIAAWYGQNDPLSAGSSYAANRDEQREQIRFYRAAVQILAADLEARKQALLDQANQIRKALK